jgi:hypothetical protein
MTNLLRLWNERGIGEDVSLAPDEQSSGKGGSRGAARGLPRG